MRRLVILRKTFETNMVARFRICDLALESNIQFPELPAATGACSDCSLEVLPAADRTDEPVSWFHHWKFVDEGIWLSFGALGEDYRLRFPEYADFLVSRHGKEVKCVPLPGTPEETLRHLFLDQVFPLLLSRREELVFHASAVLTRSGVVAFVGKTGSGKSTLAASFSRKGSQVISDDYLVLRSTPEDWVAIPSYPGVRLWRSSTEGVFSKPPPTSAVAHYTPKQRVSSPLLVPFADTAAPLHRLYFVDADGDRSQAEVCIQPVLPGDVFRKLLGSVFNIDIRDTALLKRQFAALEKLQAEVPSFRLAYPREFSRLPEVHQAIAAHIGNFAQDNAERNSSSNLVEPGVEEQD